MNISREKALDYLKDHIKDATILIICDPYIFKSSNDINLYISDFLSILPVSLSTLILIHKSEKDKATILQELKRRIPNHVNIDSFNCSSIHDRIWIIDNTKAFVTGTSFNSIGYNLSFTYDLPVEDFHSFMRFLNSKFGADFKKVIRSRINKSHR